MTQLHASGVPARVATLGSRDAVSQVSSGRPRRRFLDLRRDFMVFPQRRRQLQFALDQAERRAATGADRGSAAHHRDAPILLLPVRKQMTRLLIFLALAIGAAPHQLFAAIGCTLSNPAEDLKYLYPGDDDLQGRASGVPEAEGRGGAVQRTAGAPRQRPRPDLRNVRDALYGVQRLQGSDEDRHRPRGERARERAA